MLTPEQRFWAKVNKHGPVPTKRPDLGACWIWVGAFRRKIHGYGAFALRHDKLLSAHRFAYEVCKGKIPKSKHIDHLCSETKCVNPRHLEAVTPRVNCLRSGGVAANNARKTKCHLGHKFSRNNTYVYVSKKTGKRLRQCRACCCIRTKNYEARLRDAGK